MNKRRTIILPFGAKINDKEDITHLQVMRNKSKKQFEFRFFKKDKLIKFIPIKDMMLQVMEEKENFFIRIINNEDKENSFSITFKYLNNIEATQNLIKKIII